MESEQTRNSIAAVVLALVLLLYIFAPPSLFIAVLILLPLCAVGILAFTTDVFHEKDQ